MLGKHKPFRAALHKRNDPKSRKVVKEYLKKTMYYCYILKCSDNTLYCGYTNNIEKRVCVHNSGKGAKYTQKRLPVQLVYNEEFLSKSDAMKREYQIKQLTREQKIQLIKNGHNTKSTN
jgi:putative endonuclease